MESEKVSDGVMAELKLLDQQWNQELDDAGAERMKKDAKLMSGLRKHAKDAITSAQTAFKKYWELLVYIRDNQIPPPVVQAELKEAGFALSRIAEVKRVAFSSEDIFDAYRKNAIGFRLALDKARGAKKGEAARAPQGQLYEKALRHVVEEFVGVAGKLPNWAKRTQFQAQGCDVVVVIKRSS
jgi:hypothetical protein